MESNGYILDTIIMLDTISPLGEWPHFKFSLLLKLCMGMDSITHTAYRYGHMDYPLFISHDVR